MPKVDFPKNDSYWLYQCDECPKKGITTISAAALGPSCGRDEVTSILGGYVAKNSGLIYCPKCAFRKGSLKPAPRGGFKAWYHMWTQVPLERVEPNIYDDGEWTDYITFMRQFDMPGPEGDQLMFPIEMMGVPQFATAGSCSPTPSPTPPLPGSSAATPPMPPGLPPSAPSLTLYDLSEQLNQLQAMIVEADRVGTERFEALQVQMFSLLHSISDARDRPA